MSSPGPWGPQQDPRRPRGMQYRGFGAFEQPPKPPKRKRLPWLIGLAAATAVLLAVVTGVAFLAPGRERAQPAPAPPSPESAPPTAAGTSTAAPLEPGWQVARVPKRSALYDVPPNWRVDPSPEAVYGFGEPGDAVTVTGVSTFQRGFCPDQPNSYRATAGATARGGPDDTAVAAETSRQFIAKAYTRHGVAPIATPGPPERISLPGGMPAVRINTEVVLPRPDPCDSPRIAVSVVAANNDGNGSVVLITSADQQIPDAVGPDVLDRIGESLRAG